MAKYKLLKEVVAYNYNSIPGIGGNVNIKDTVRFIIPIGTIVEGTPMGFNGGADPITANAFQINLSTKYGKTWIINSIDRGIYLEQVGDSTPVTLDANIIPKDVLRSPIELSSSPAGANPESKNIIDGILVHKNIILGILAIVIGVLILKWLKVF